MHTYLLQQHIVPRVILIANQHDDIPQFRLWHAVAMIISGVVLNLGVFTVLVALHMALDVIKYRSRHGLDWYRTVTETVRESLIDIFFILLGLFLAILFHHAIAIGGLGRLARAEALLLGLVIRMGPRLKIAENLLKVVAHWKHHLTEAIEPLSPLSRSERMLAGITVALMFGLFALPFFTAISANSIVAMATHELTPRLEMGITETIDSLGL